MPRTVPSPITAKQGSGALFFIWLVELHPATGGAFYLSSGPAVTFGGNSYTANRVKSIDGVTAQYIDRKRRDFGNVTIVLDNLADDGGSSFPYTGLEGSVDLTDARLFVHSFDVDANDGVDAIWSGYVKNRVYSPDDETVSVEASVLWDSPGIVIPSATIQQYGFAELDANANKDSLVGETALPLVYGAGNFLMRPTIYAFRNDGDSVFVNGIVSGCGPTPFASTDLDASRMKLFAVTPATTVDWTHRGLASDPVPTDITKFPDGLAHNFIAYFQAVFPILPGNRDKIDGIEAGDIKMNIANGRSLIDTSLPSQNGILIIKDILRDPKFGMGLASTDIDDVTAAANIAGLRWQCRLELHEQVSVGDFLQGCCAELHGFLTFNGRKVQLGMKHNAESPIATFATSQSGHGGLTVHNDLVTPTFESADQAVNQANIDFRQQNRHPRQLVAYDSNAQARAGGTIRKVEKDSLEFNLLFDRTQVGISGAITLREEQNARLLIEFEAPLPESLPVAPGDLITVWSENIPNNGSNNVFRVIGQTFSGDDEPLCKFSCQVYKQSVYDYSTAGIGIDLIRSGTDVGTTGRPPDVVPVSLQLIDKVATDVEGTQGHFRAIFTYPVVDLAGDAAAGTNRQYPIDAVQLYCRFADTESPNEWKLVKEVRYPTPQADFYFDFLKSKTIQVLFVALGLNRSHGPLGWVPDPTRISALTANLSATSPTALVGDSGPFSAGEVLTEFEIDMILSKSAGQLNLQSSGGNRLPFYNTQAIAHPTRTQIAMAKISYPFLTLALSAPRFTYPPVTVFTMFQRKENVQVKIGDISAENLEDYFTYWTITPSFATDGTKLGIATPAWYLTNPLNPPAGIVVISGKATKFQIAAEDLGGSGISVWARCAARNGKHNWSTQLSPLGTNKAGDDAVPIPNAPKVIPKPKGVRVKTNLPSLNVKTLTKVLVVIEARNGASAILGYLSDPTVGSAEWESSVTEFRFDQGLAAAHTYATKNDVLTLWPTVATLRIRLYLVNDVGTSLVSADTIVNVATWSVELNDTGPPNNGVALAIKRAKIKKGAKFVIDFDLPSVQMATFDHLVLILHDNNATGAGRRFYDHFTSSWVAAYPDGKTELSFGQGSIPGLPITPAEIFVGGRTQFFVVIGVYNRFGGSSVTYSADLGTVITQAGSEVSSVDQDTAVPDPSAVIPIWTQSGKHGHYTLSLQGVTQVNTHTRTELVIFAANAGGTLLGYLARNSGGDYIFSGAENLFDIAKGGVFDLNLKKADLLSLFPTIATLKAYYYVSNTLGRSVNHSQTLVVNYSSIVDYLSGRSAVNVIEVGETAVGTHNFCRNGEFDKNDPANTNKLRYWNRWGQVSAAVLIDANTSPIRTNTPGIIFSKTEHNISIIDGAWFLVQNLGRVLKPGEWLTLQMVVKGNPSGFAPVVKGWLVKDNVVSTLAQLTSNNLLDFELTLPLATLTGGGLSTTVYKSAAATERVSLTANLDDGSGLAAQIWLVVGVPAGFISPNILKIDRLDLHRGRQPKVYEDNALDVIGVEDTGATGLIPANVGDFPDTLYTPSGTQGGFYVGGGTGGGYQ